LSEVFLDKYEKENRVIELHLAGTLLIQTFKDCPEISFGFGGIRTHDILTPLQTG
jgi:hypothetical protein